MSPKLPEGAKKALYLFNEKAEKLHSNAFTRSVLESSPSVNFAASVDKPLTTELSVPDQDAIDGFVLTMRFFCQDRDGISLRKMAEVYSCEAMPEEIKERYHDAHVRFNGYLDQPTGVQIDGQAITNREVWNVFLYGELAHADPEKKTVYDRWMSMGPVAGFLRFRFNSILIEWLNITGYVRNLNLIVLDDIDP